jgi:hypothetical protein
LLSSLETLLILGPVVDLGIENWTWRFYNSRDLPNLKETSVTLPFIAG